MAAKSKLTPALLDKLDAVADDGLTIKEVCRHVGIEPRTFRRWEARTDDDPLLVSFRPLAARVRVGMGSAIDDDAWGVLREVMLDGSARDSDRVHAAASILRLRTPHRVEHSGPEGAPLTLAMLASLATDDAEGMKKGTV